MDSTRIAELQKQLQDIQEELQRLMMKSPALELPWGAPGYVPGFLLDPSLGYTGPQLGLRWAYTTRAQVIWASKHAIAWAIIRYYADKLNPPNLDRVPYPYYLNLNHVGETYICCGYSKNRTNTEIYFARRDALQAALDELGNDKRYPWPALRTSEEKSTDKPA